MHGWGGGEGGNLDTIRCTSVFSLRSPYRSRQRFQDWCHKRVYNYYHRLPLSTPAANAAVDAAAACCDGGDKDAADHDYHSVFSPCHSLTVCCLL